MQFLPHTKSFMDVPENEVPTLKKAQAVIIPFGLEATVFYGKGTGKGPQAMLDASKKVELFDDELWCEPYKDIGILTVKEPKIQKPNAKALTQLENLVEEVLAMGKFPFVFGGEHAITSGAIRPYVRRYKDLHILHFDAHADLRDIYYGEKYSHACALRRTLDYKGVKLFSFGIRSISQVEIPFLEANSHRVKIYWAREKHKWKMKEIVRHFKGKNVYLTFDIDGLDPGQMPATGTPEPGGLLWDEAINIIREVAKVSTIVGADINELAPRKDLHACDFLAAKLAYKILSYVFLLGRKNKAKRAA